MGFIARVDLTGSSSGYQRYQLVDMTIRHFNMWWLIGTPDYVNWGWDSWDLCNQFAAVALTGGLLTLIFYIGIFNAASQPSATRASGLKAISGRNGCLWCLGATLFATVVAHFGINYMAQLIMGLFPLIACISGSPSRRNSRRRRSAQVPDEKRFGWAPLAVSADSMHLRSDAARPAQFLNEKRGRFN